MSWLSNIGHAVGNIGSKVAPLVGMIPGVGTLAATGIGALSGALKEGGGLKGAIQGGIGGAAGGLINKIPGVSGMLGKIGGVLGQGAKDTFMPNGKLDLGKVIGAGGAVSSIIGQNKQRKSAENYNNTNIDQRNQLLSKILAPKSYGMPKITPATQTNDLNQQAHDSGAY